MIVSIELNDRVVTIEEDVITATEALELTNSALLACGYQHASIIEAMLILTEPYADSE